jgi:hypothetical protein
MLAYVQLLEFEKVTIIPGHWKKGRVKKNGLVVDVFESIIELKSTEEESSSSSSSLSDDMNVSFERI